MATNSVSNGEFLEITSPYALTSGDGCLVGAIYGVAQSTVAITTAVTIALRGVHTLAKTTGTAWTAGQRLAWDDTTKKLTTTLTSNFAVGFATVAAASGDTTGKVLLGRSTAAGI